jgi:DNA polymerase (family 10)
MENAEIAAAFDEIADLLDIQEANRFRIRSYRSAARTVRDASQRLADLVAKDDGLEDLPNIGESMAEKIRELVESGTCKRLEELRKKSPAQLTELLSIPGLGPKKVKGLHEELGVKALDELKKAAQDKRVRELEGMGPKTEERILKGIENLEEYGGRILLKEASEYAESLGRHLDEIAGIQDWQIAGSFRRRKETIGDLDVLVRAKDREQVADEITQHDSVADVISKGTDKVRVRLRNGLAVDLLFFRESEFGSALLYFTGSKSHNIALRKRARRRHWKLSEHGLFNGRKRLAGKTEAEVYKKLKLPLIPPELREDHGEVDAAEKDDLPKLIDLDDIRGDLHAHTTATDGKQSIKEMAKAAKERGYDYLAITDHSKAVHVANGLDEDRLRKHADKIRKVNGQLKGFRLLAGIEVDILKDGRLDLDEKLLDELDWVNGAVHSHFGLSEKKMTERLLKAIGSGVIHCVAHPFGRQIGSRKPIKLDLDQVLEACAEHGVCLEINAYPDRLDLPDIHCQRAKEAGVKMVISTDAHKKGDLDFMPYGVSVARRGWLEKRDVLNTVTAQTIEKRMR